MNIRDSSFRDVRNTWEPSLQRFVVNSSSVIRNSLLSLLAMCCFFSFVGARPIDIKYLTTEVPNNMTLIPHNSLEKIIDELVLNVTIHHDVYRRSLERWSNACELPGFVFDSESLEMVPPAKPIDTARSILLATKSAKVPAQKLFRDYGIDVFRSDQVNMRDQRQKISWLPEANRKEVQHMSLKRAIKYFSDKLPFYGIAMTQVTMDQILYGGPFVEESRDAEIILTQDVCQLQLGGLSLGVRPSRTETTEVMKKQYKDMKSKSQRDMRDLLILRDYNEFLNVMEETFEYLLERTLKNTSESPDESLQ